MTAHLRARGFVLAEKGSGHVLWSQAGCTGLPWGSVRETWGRPRDAPCRSQGVSSAREPCGLRVLTTRSGSGLRNARLAPWCLPRAAARRPERVGDAASRAAARAVGPAPESPGLRTFVRSTSLGPAQHSSRVGRDALLGLVPRTGQRATTTHGEPRRSLFWREESWPCLPPHCALQLLMEPTDATQRGPQPVARREPLWEQSLVSGAGTGLPACPLLATPTLTLGWTCSTGSRGRRAPRGPAVQGLLLK